ncbi:MAG: hypothetical protein LBS41_01540 [Streptococcaceae bacterium]|jgi:hypothetical protein|nr:hypothetical protein [Streptococcaceae bacterium]
MTKLLQRLSRMTLALFAIILLFIGGMSFQRYLTEHRDTKTAVVGRVIRTDDGEKMVAYTYQGKAYQEVPIANFLKTFGKVGDRVTVYVNNHQPKHIYIKTGATSLLILASILTGWALLICLILGFEYWFIHKLQHLDEAVEEGVV